jgi:hypothetical protein
MIMRKLSNCILFNKHTINYFIVELGSIEHLQAVKQGYEYRGPAYVANITEIDIMNKANEVFIKNI